MDLSKKLLDDFLSGGLAGAAAKTVVAPIERVKLLLQLQKGNTQFSKILPYNGLIDCCRRIYHEQGLASFWRGNTVNITRYFPSQAMNFAVWDRYREYFLSGISPDNMWLYFQRSMLVGGLTGGTSLFALYPFDFARTRVGVDVGVGSARLYSGGIDCIKKVIEIDGIRGLYRGFDAAFVGIFAWRMLYFGSYDSATMYLYGKRRGGSVFDRFLLAQSITALAGTIIYPLDTLRRRMMMQSGEIGSVAYQNSLSCAISIAKNEGFMSFYGGLSANLLRSIGGALMLVMFDEIKAVLN